MGRPAEATDAALRHLYESFPYPKQVEGLDDFKAGRREPVWNPKTSFEVFFPEQVPRRDLDVLVAGCGTNLGPVFGATLPQARVTAVDISAASLEISRTQAEAHDIGNVTHHQLRLEDIAELGGTYDFICCTGVLHHLADPVAGLRALAGVLRDDGAMMVMVYGRYGRHGIYLLQELAGLLGMKVCELDAARLQRLLTLLPQTHPFRRIYPRDGRPISLEEVMDMVLNPRDISYRVLDIKRLIEEAGLRLHRWLGNADYRPAMTALGAANLLDVAEALDPWQQAAAAELAFGNLKKHSFVLTHPHRLDAESLFGGGRIAAARPRLSAHLTVNHVGDELVVSNDAHQNALEIRAPVGDIAPVLSAADGRTTVGALVGADSETGLALFRQLYHADAISLSLASEP